MSEQLGSVAYDRDPRPFLNGPGLPVAPHEQDYAEETAAAIDKEVRAIVQRARDRALQILRDRRELLKRSARRLLEKETIDERELAQLAGRPARVAAE